MKRQVIVVGGGTAGLITALSLLRESPGVPVSVIRSKAMGHIMVGEGTFAATPRFIHDYLAISREDFYRDVNPTWKLGVRFEWGPRPYFDYPFPFAVQQDNQILPSSSKGWGYYGLHECKLPATARETPEAIEARLRNGSGYHFENQRFVELLERRFEALGGELIDATVVSGLANHDGVRNITLHTGEVREADFFVDASGFSGRLINGMLDEPYVDMRKHLFCDKAVVGGWERARDEPVRLYTTVETMDAGWCWRIEHERFVNRGYVHCSAFISEDQAIAEYLAKNPRVDPSRIRIVPFETRHIRHAWVKNVIAVGNACGFVEPLEATNIQLICNQARLLAEGLAQEEITPQTVANFNAETTRQWANIRDFLAMHYRFNERLDTPFWQTARRETPLGDLEEYIQAYRHGGPLLLSGERMSNYMFGHDGCLAILLGMQVPWASCAVR